MGQVNAIQKIRVGGRSVLCDESTRALSESWSEWTDESLFVRWMRVISTATMSGWSARLVMHFNSWIWAYTHRCSISMCGAAR
jgi:hypothetical protein